MGSGTSTNVRILYYDASLFRQPAPIYLLGAKQLYFNRFAANCNPMNSTKYGFSKAFFERVSFSRSYERGLDFEKELSFKQVYVAPDRESSLFMTHTAFTG